MKRLMIMAAGTGGHIFPGLAIARTMQARGWHVTWLGTQHGMEGSIVPAQGIEMDTIHFAGMRGRGVLHLLRGGLQLLGSFFACLSIIRRRQPNVVLGMGGYVTVPGGFVAGVRGLPLVLVNADAALLLSNKLLASAAQKVLFGFEADFGKAASKVLVTGNPVREEIRTLPQPQQRFAERSGSLRVLVIGGSLGAKVLNETLPQALAKLESDERPVIVHQSGKQHIEALQQAYADVQVEAEVVDFIDDMARRYAEADLVICRAGAITVSELTAAGVASILVPFVVSSTAHQHENASMMAQHQAAIHLPQTEMNPTQLAGLLQSMTREKCLEMAKAAWALGKRDANERIAEVLEQLSGTTG